jgi:hypothetical protein
VGRTADAAHVVEALVALPDSHPPAENHVPYHDIVRAFAYIASTGRVTMREQEMIGRLKALAKPPLELWRISGI